MRQMLPNRVSADSPSRILPGMYWNPFDSNHSGQINLLSGRTAILGFILASPLWVVGFIFLKVAGGTCVEGVILPSLCSSPAPLLGKHMKQIIIVPQLLNTTANTTVHHVRQHHPPMPPTKAMGAITQNRHGHPTATP